MYFSLALKNVKKSYKDFLIYFITLTFAVCTFYVFNSMCEQPFMLELSKTKRMYVDLLFNLINGISVFVSFILGFLILYANNFLVKRRHKELGIYLTLGMNKRNVSLILFFETVLIGFISLIIGIVLGVFISQILGIATMKMFLIKVEKFVFMFSLKAMLKTILYFGLMFLVVVLFNTFIISKYKLIDLLYAEKKNQSLKTRNLYVSVVIFIISIICLVIAYKLIIKNQMMSFDAEFWASLILGFIGTILFFMSLSGFLLKLVQSNKALYFKDLNMFVLRQINSKINTTFISISMICLMLFVSIGFLATGLAICMSTNQNIKDLTPYGGTFCIADENTQYIGINISKSETSDIKLKEYANTDEKASDLMKKYDLDIDKYAESYYDYKVYYTDKNVVDFLSDSNYKAIEDIKNSLYNHNVKVSAISLTDYNNLMDLQCEDNISLDENEIIFTSQHRTLLDMLNKYLKNNKTLDIMGKGYTAKSKAIMDITKTAYFADTNLMLIVPDNCIKDLTNYSCYVDMNFIDETGEQMINDYIDKYSESDDLPDSMADLLPLTGITKALVLESMSGISTIVVYVGVYIGLIFIITCVSILALQQLSESTDNKRRYRILSNMGVSDSMINKSIFKNIFIYFAMPLLLALVHSVVGLYVANNVVIMFGNGSIVKSSIIIVLLICVIYGGYFLTTYSCSKNIIKAK